MSDTTPETTQKRPPNAILQVALFFLIWIALQTLLSIPVMLIAIQQSLSRLTALSPDTNGSFDVSPEALEAALGGFAPGNPLVLGLTAVSMVATIVTVVIMRFIASGPRLLDLGLHPAPGWLRQSLLGLALGPLMFLAILVIQLLAGWARVGPGNIGPGTFLVAFTSFVFVAIGEEILARGFVLQVLERQFGTISAVISSSAIFSVLHGLNPGITLVALIGLFVAGLLFGYAYTVTRQLWLPIALHLSWNVSEGPVFGFPVSGLPSNGLLEVQVTGPELITGGRFGPEAGLVVLVGIGIAAGVIAVWQKSGHRA